MNERTSFAKINVRSSRSYFLSAPMLLALVAAFAICLGAGSKEHILMYTIHHIYAFFFLISNF